MYMYIWKCGGFKRSGIVALARPGVGGWSEGQVGISVAGAIEYPKLTDLDSILIA